MRHKNLALCLLFLTASVQAAEPGSRILTFIAGAEPGIGQIKASLFDSSGSYLRAPLQELTEVVDTTGNATLDFGQHPSGKYAVVVFFDRNSNGQLDTGVFGIPQEKVGFSNNARSRFGPAKWHDVHFVLADTDYEVHIQLAKVK